ncbi:MAG: hypothetical protein II241_03345, partial [Clostridia bacterium]|nr:hypothetical protein [Clostridia bacterium]
GEKLAQAVGAMLYRMHEGEAPFVFRIELKSRLEQDKKGAYIRKISDAIILCMVFSLPRKILSLSIPNFRFNTSG